MAEVVGAVSAVIAIAACGAKLSRILYQMTTKTVHASDSINKVAMNVTLFSSTLSHLGRVLKETEWLQTEEVVITVTQLVERCQGLFDEITRLTTLSNQPRKDGTYEVKGRKKLVQHVKYYFTKPTVEHLLAELEYLKTTLSVILNTLNLAALSAKMKQDQAILAASEQARIQAEAAETNARVQVETLIVARQIAFIVLTQIVTGTTQDANGDWVKSPITSNSLSSEDGMETPSQKMLTAGGETNNSLVKLETTSFPFFEGRSEPPAEDSLSPIMRAAPGFVDKLLNRWTRLEEVEAREPTREEIIQRGPPRDSAFPSNAAMMPPRVGPPKISKRRTSDADDASWDVIGSSDGSDPYASSPKLGSSPNRRRNPPQIITSPFPNMLGNALLVPPQPMTAPLTRTMSVPESDLPQDQPMVHYQPEAHPPPDQRGPQTGESLPFAMHSQLSSVTSPSNLARSPNGSNLHYYALPWRSGGPPPGSNYRKPYVETSTEESGSSDEESGRRPRVRRRDSARSKRSSGMESTNSIGGLEIPWRLRISSTRYFDFVDEKLVGPRTPDLPKEKLSWVYAHDNSCTEVSKSWVSELAIAEKMYPYSELKKEDLNPGSGSGWLDDHVGGWRLHQPLKFVEVEALVERTIQIYEASQNKSSSRTASPETVRAPGGLKLPSPNLRPPNMIPRNAGGSVRSVSFASENATRPDFSARGGAQPPMNRPPPQPSASSEATSSRRSPQPTQGSSRYGGPPALSQQQSSERDRDRGYRNRHRDDDEDEEDQRYRKDERHRRRKKKTSSYAGTMAKIGGLAALLEGLEGAF